MVIYYSKCFPDCGLILCSSELMLVCQSSTKVILPDLLLVCLKYLTSELVLNCHLECYQYRQF